VENPADDYVFSTWEVFNEHIQPSVVRIDVQPMGSTSQGSGFVVDAEGIVATNYHVIGGAERITVTFKNGEDYIVSGYVYLDSNKDIALLRNDPASGDQQLKALPLLPEPPQTGSEVAAFSPPHGFDFTFTPGNVRAYRTSYEMQKPDSTVREGNWVQHTAAISKGSSGGPLVNRAGRVIAMHTLYVSAAQNLNLGVSSGDLQLLLNRRTSLLKVSAESVPDLNPNPSER
jgi:S1-C subfamily serine protease